MVSFDLTRPKEVPQTVHVGDQHFGIMVRRQTAQEHLEELSALANGNLIAFQEMRLARIVGWADINDKDGKPIPFTKENLDAVCQSLDFLKGIIDALNDQDAKDSIAKTEEIESLRAAVRSSLSGKGDIEHPLLSFVAFILNNEALVKRFGIPLETILSMDAMTVALIREAVNQADATMAAMAKDS